VPQHLVPPAELEEKRRRLAPSWQQVTVCGLTSAQVSAAASQDGMHGRAQEAGEPPAKRVRKGAKTGGGQGDGQSAEQGAGDVSQEGLRKGVVDQELGIRFWRLSNGVRVSYKKTQFEAGQVTVRLVSRGGKMVEIGGAGGMGGMDGMGQGAGGGASGQKKSARKGGNGGKKAADNSGDDKAEEPAGEQGARPGQLGELSLALDTLMDSGLGDLCAQDVERYLTLHAVGVDSAVSMESVSITLSVSTADGGLERVLQVAHAMLASGRFDPEAFERAKKERQIEYQQRRKSLNGLTWEALMRSATGSDARFLQMDPALLEALTLAHASQALQAALRPEHLEFVIVGDVSHADEELADLLLLYLGTLSGGVPSDHPSAVHWRRATECSHACRRLPILDVSHKESEGQGPRGAEGVAAVEASRGAKSGGGKTKRGVKAGQQSTDSGEVHEWQGLLTCPRRTMRVKLLDEEPRAVIYILARTCGFYGQTASGNLSQQVGDGRRLHLTRSFHVLSKVLNNRLHDELREKMGLGYSASFGTVQYSLLDGGFAYACVTAFPDKIDETVTAALSILQSANTRPVTQSELVKARDPITASEKSVLASNNTWLSYCSDLQSTSVPKDIVDVRGVFKHYASLTCDDVQAAARLCLRPQSVHISIGTTSGGKP